MTDTSISRRTVLKGAAAGGAAAALAGPFSALLARAAAAAPSGAAGRPTGLDYGPLYPVKDQTTGLELLLLPKGFEYLTYGWTGDTMSDGLPTPGVHDGMAAFRTGDRVHLVRNHERGSVGPAAISPSYDPNATGGCTNLVFDPEAGQFLESYWSLAGTIRNCAGGPTPYDTWLSCEETLVQPSTTPGLTKNHGYVFEVPSTGIASAQPLTAMGRFSHEATATDPMTGDVYETEDTGESCFYRFVPVDPADLAKGGSLYALRITGARNTSQFGFRGNPESYDTRLGQLTGDTYTTDWVLVDDPDPAVPSGATSVARQSFAKGAARFVRGEGAWYGNGVVYFASTSGGNAGQGQIFAYDPASGTLALVYESPGSASLNAPDNLCVSPRGGLVICEDGSGLEYLHGLTPDGQIFRFAQNNVILPPGFKGYPNTDYSGSEWCGACFEPKNGNWMFVNIQSPGITFAITGPWRKGVL